MENFIMRLTIPVLISVVLGLISFIDIRSHGEELIKNLGKEHIVVRYPRSYLGIGYADILFFLILFAYMILFPNDSVQPWVVISVSLFLALGLYIVLLVKIWKIDVYRSKPYFTYRTFFKKTEIQYSDCISYKYESNCIAIKTKNGTIRIAENATNYEFLLGIIRDNGAVEIRDKN